MINPSDETESFSLNCCGNEADFCVHYQLPFDYGPFVDGMVETSLIYGIIKCIIYDTVF